MGKKQVAAVGKQVGSPAFYARLTPGVEGVVFAWCETCCAVVGKPDSFRPTAPEVELLLDMMREHDAMHLAERA